MNPIQVSPGSANSSGANSISDSFATLPIAGNAVVVVALLGDNAAITPATFVTDNQGNTYISAVSAANEAGSDGFNVRTVIFYCASIGAVTGPTFTVTGHVPTTGGFSGLQAFELPAGATLDTGITASNGTTAATTPVTCTTGTTPANTTTNALVIAGLIFNGYGAGTGITTPATYTAGLTENNGTLTVTCAVAYKALAATATQSGSWGTAIQTGGSPGNWSSAIAVFKAGTGGATGSGATTEASDVASGSGSASTSGSGAPTEAHDIAAGAGSTSTSGSGAPTEAHDIAAGSGSASTSGSGATTEAPDVAAGAGSSSTTGAGATTESPDIAAGAGMASTSGSGAPTEAPDIAAGSGTATTGASGSGAPTEAPDIAAGSGSTSTSGSGAPTEAPDVAAGSGSVSTSGSGATTEAPDIASGSGVAGAGGVGAPTEAPDVAAGAGSTATAGSGATTEAHDIAAGSGSASTSGSGAPTEAPDVAAGSGNAGNTATGSGATTEAPDTATGSGSVSGSIAPQPGMGGSFASRILGQNLEILAPFASALGGGGAWRAAPGGLLQGRFAWGSAKTGYAGNAPVSIGDVLGIVVPLQNVNGTNGGVIGGPRGFGGPQAQWTWQVYDPRFKAWRLREGVVTTLMTGGNFWLCFPFGANYGDTVYASLTDGSAISGALFGAVLTPWKVCGNAKPGGRAPVSSTARF